MLVFSWENFLNTLEKDVGRGGGGDSVHLGILQTKKYGSFNAIPISLCNFKLDYCATENDYPPMTVPF